MTIQKVDICFDTVNSAFDEDKNFHIAYILRQLADRIERGVKISIIKDFNGNFIGTITLTEGGGMMCNSCEVININGVNCHESGCPESYIGTTRICQWCGKDYEPLFKSQNCCSPECIEAYYG